MNPTAQTPAAEQALQATPMNQEETDTRRELINQRLKANIMGQLAQALSNRQYDAVEKLQQ